MPYRLYKLIPCYDCYAHTRCTVHHFQLGDWLSISPQTRNPIVYVVLLGKLAILNDCHEWTTFGSWIGFNVTRHHQQHFIHHSNVLHQCIEKHWFQAPLAVVDFISAVKPDTSCLMEAKEHVYIPQHSSYEMYMAYMYQLLHLGSGECNMTRYCMSV